MSPTLTPAIPEPLPPAARSSASSEELAFFDRVKKYIGNKQTMNEFLKLCNLFSQDLIDRNVLVHKVSNFIGGNPELMNWFKNFVGFDGSDEVIENRPRAPTGKVSLSNCRGFGPSYRLLPRRVRFTLFHYYLILPASRITFCIGLLLVAMLLCCIMQCCIGMIFITIVAYNHRSCNAFAVIFNPFPTPTTLPSSYHKSHFTSH